LRALPIAFQALFRFLRALKPLKTVSLSQSHLGNITKALCLLGAKNQIACKALVTYTFPLTSLPQVRQGQGLQTYSGPPARILGHICAPYQPSLLTASRLYRFQSALLLSIEMLHPTPEPLSAMLDDPLNNTASPFYSGLATELLSFQSFRGKTMLQDLILFNHSLLNQQLTLFPPLSVTRKRGLEKSLSCTHDAKAKCLLLIFFFISIIMELSLSSSPSPL